MSGMKTEVIMKIDAPWAAYKIKQVAIKKAPPFHTTCIFKEKNKGKIVTETSKGSEKIGTFEIK